MMIFTQLEHALLSLADVVPVEIFTFVGAAVEEIIAPIPSPIVMTLTGTLAEAQAKPFVYLFYLALIGAIGKTFGSWVVYIVSDKAEDFILRGKISKFLGVSHKDVEKIGAYFSGGIKDDIILFLARAIPVMPTAPVSIVCGIIKVNMRTYIVSTFLGTYVRNMAYLYLGYAGFASYQELTQGFEGVESVVQMVMAAIVGLLLVWLFYRRERQDENLFEKVKAKLGL